MAGKGGGGAWKVAYADFVTAMMAFFLVMWLCAQNTEVKRSVSNYFSDPLGTVQGGDEKKANRTGALSEHISSGTVPLSEGVAMGHGRKSHSRASLHSPSTKLISDWMGQDKKVGAYWRKQVEDQLEAARWSKDVKEKRSSIREVALRKLARQLEEELTREIPANASGVSRDLVLRAFREVNWTELAEDLLGS